MSEIAFRDRERFNFRNGRGDDACKRAQHTMPAAGLEAARTSSSCRSSNNPLLAQSSSSIDGFLCIDRHGFVELPPSVPCTAHCYAWLDGPAILWGACVDCCGKDGSVETADHTPHQAPGLKIADSGLRINGVKRLPPGQYKLWLSCSRVEAAAGSTLEVVRPGQSKVLPNQVHHTRTQTHTHM